MFGKRFRNEAAISLKQTLFPSSDCPIVFQMRCFLGMRNALESYST